MASFTSQAGIADINNTAALVRAIATAPKKNPFIDIKLPESLQSENSTDNAFKKLQMRTESLRGNSIVAGDKLAVQKNEMLKAKNKFDRGMAEKEYTLKDNMQTFNMGNTKRLTDSSIKKDNSDIKFNADRLIETQRKNKADEALEDNKFVANESFRYNELDDSRTQQKVDNKNKAIEMDRDLMKINAKIYQDYVNGLISEKELNQRIAESKTAQKLAKLNIKLKEQAEKERIDAAAKAKKDVIDDVNIGTVIETFKSPASTFDKVLSTDASVKVLKDGNIAPFVKDYDDMKKTEMDALGLEVNPEGKIVSKDSVSPEVKDFLKKVELIKSEGEKGVLSKDEVKLKISTLAKNVEFMNADKKATKLFVDKKNGPKEWMEENIAPVAYAASSFASTPAAFKKGYDSVKGWLNKGTEAEELAKKIAKQNKTKYNKNAYDPYDQLDGNIKFIQDKIRRNNSSVGKFNDKVVEGSKTIADKYLGKGLGSDDKITNTKLTLKTIRKNQIVPEATFNAGLRAETVRTKQALRDMMNLKPTDPRHINAETAAKAIKRVDERNKIARENYTLLKSLLATQLKRELDFEEKKTLLRLESAAKTGEIVTKAELDAKQSKKDNDVKIKVAELKK